MIINMCPMARESLYPSPARLSRSLPPQPQQLQLPVLGPGAVPARPPDSPVHKRLIFSGTLWSDVALRPRGSSPGFLPAYSSRFKSPGQLRLPIPTPAGLSFLGQELLVQFISLAASPPSAGTCTLVPCSFFFPSLSSFMFSSCCFSF